MTLTATIATSASRRSQQLAAVTRGRMRALQPMLSALSSARSERDLRRRLRRRPSRRVRHHLLNLAHHRRRLHLHRHRHPLNLILKRGLRCSSYWSPQIVSAATRHLRLRRTTICGSAPLRAVGCHCHPRQLHHSSSTLEPLRGCPQERRSLSQGQPWC